MQSRANAVPLRVLRFT